MPAPCHALKTALNNVSMARTPEELIVAIKALPPSIEAPSIEATSSHVFGVGTRNEGPFVQGKQLLLRTVLETKELRPQLWSVEASDALGGACSAIDLYQRRMNTDGTIDTTAETGAAAAAAAVAAPANLTSAFAPLLGRAKCRLAWYDFAVVAALSSVVLGMLIAKREFGPFFALDVALLLLGCAHFAITLSHNNCAVECCHCCSTGALRSYPRWRLCSRRLELLLFEIYFFLYFAIALIGLAAFFVYACLVPSRIDSFCATRDCPAHGTFARDFASVSVMFGLMLAAVVFLTISGVGISLTRTYSSLLILSASGDGVMKWCSHPSGECVRASTSASAATARRKGETTSDVAVAAISADCDAPGALVRQSSIKVFGVATACEEGGDRGTAVVPVAVRDGLYTPLTCATDAVAWHVLPGQLCFRKHSLWWKNCSVKCRETTEDAGEEIQLGRDKCKESCATCAATFSECLSSTFCRLGSIGGCCCACIILPFIVGYIVNTTYSAKCIENAYLEDAKFHPAFNMTFPIWRDPQSFCMTANILWWLLSIWFDIIVLILVIFSGSSGGGYSGSSFGGGYSPFRKSRSAYELQNTKEGDLIAQQERNLLVAYLTPAVMMGIICILLCVSCGMCVVRRILSNV